MKDIKYECSKTGKNAKREYIGKYIIPQSSVQTLFAILWSVREKMQMFAVQFAYSYTAN